METSLFSQPRGLLGLPDELKLQIVNFLDKRRDLYNLSRTCHVLEDVVVSRLYYNVDVEIPPMPRPSNSSGLFAFRDPVMQSVRELTIRNGMVEGRNSVHGGWRVLNAGSVEGYLLNEILDKVPANQLTSFTLLHQTPLNRQMLDLLTHRHERTLQSLHFYESSPWQEDTAIPRNLKSLEVHTVNEGEGVEKLISANKSALERLSLGQGKYLLDRYHQSRVGFLDSIPQPVGTFLTTALSSLEKFNRLRDLSLSGLNVTHLLPASIPEVCFFNQLERLSLESCPGTTDLLESLALTFYWMATSPDAPQQPRLTPSLKTFLLRHEAPTSVLKDTVIRFLSSFTGLHTLSLLFENGAILDRPAAFISSHGPTLQTLVFESRIQPREHLSHDTTRPVGVGGYTSDFWSESINDVARLCPNLVSLGMGFPWMDEMVRLRKTTLPTLRHLRTVHVRNFPENHNFSQLGDYSIKEYAGKFVEWVFPTRTGGERPSLENLAIGPTLYESRYRIVPPTSSVALRRNPPQFLRTHRFCLDWAQTRFGQWSSLITPVSERFVEEMAGEKPLGGVFEPVWLK